MVSTILWYFRPIQSSKVSLRDCAVGDGQHFVSGHRARYCTDATRLPRFRQLRMPGEDGHQVGIETGFQRASDIICLPGLDRISRRMAPFLDIVPDRGSAYDLT
jgi:hypothetical protein